MKRMFILLFLFHILGCAKEYKPEVVVYTSVDQIFSQPVLQDFEKETGIRVKAIYDTEEAKSTGVVNRLLAERDNSQADVFWSGDIFRVIFLKEKGILSPYTSPNASSIPESFKDREGYWTGFSARARVMVYNKNLLEKGEIPSSILELTHPKWKGKIAMPNPLFGTTTVHAASLFLSLGDQRAREFFSALKENEVIIVASNSEALKMVASGRALVGLTDTDDAFVAKKEGRPIEVIFPDSQGMGTLIIPNAVCLIKGGPHPQEGEILIDYLLSPAVEDKLAQSAAQVPLHLKSKVPEDVFSLSSVAGMKVDYEEVGKKLEQIQPFLKIWVGM